MDYEYITNDFISKTKYKTVRDAYDRDHLSVVKYGNAVWLYTRWCPPSIIERAYKELHRIYPDCLVIRD